MRCFNTCQKYESINHCSLFIYDRDPPPKKTNTSIDRRSLEADTVGALRASDVQNLESDSLESKRVNAKAPHRN